MRILKFIAAAVSIFFVSCSQDKVPVAVQKPVAIAKIPQPFTFHKAIEVKPGLTLDVLSWGRGSKSVGAYLVLRSDSTHLKYRSISGELDGKIKDAWNMDMDSDGNTELFIQVQGEGEGSEFNMFVYEYNDSGTAQEIRFPELTSSKKKQYRGKDSVYIKDGKLRREFPLFSDDEQNNSPSESKKILEYSLKGNTFSVKEIKEEDLAKEKSEEKGKAVDKADSTPLMQ